MTRTPVPLGGRPRWQPILCAVFVPLSLLWAVSREYWRTWITTTPGRVIAGCIAANAALSVISLAAVATISDPPANDAVGWYRDSLERVAFWSTGVVGYLPICLGTAALVVGIWLGWRTADELGTPTKPALVNGADQ